MTMNKKGNAVIILILVLVIAVLIYVNYLGGEGKADEIKKKLAKISCPDVNTNMTCDYGINMYSDSRGCVVAECKTPNAPEHISELTGLQVFFVDVGQGDGIYIETPEDKHVVIDCGRGYAMADWLQFRGIDKIDWLITTHPDADHIGGCDEIFDQFVVLNYGKPNISCDTQTCEELESYLPKEEGLKSWIISTGFQFEGLDLNWNVVNPNVDIVFDDRNDNSVVIKLSYGEVDTLFTGDCGEDCEKMLVLLERNISADILKVAHHGSKYSTSANFLAEVMPAYAVISYGDTNSYGHPSQEVLDRLTSLNTKIAKTAPAGTIEMRTDGTKVEWYCDKKADCFS